MKAGLPVELGPTPFDGETCKVKFLDLGVKNVLSEQ